MIPLLWCFRASPPAEMQEKLKIEAVQESQDDVRDERWMHPSFQALLHRDHLSPIPESPQRLGHSLAGDVCHDRTCPCMGSTTPASLPRPFEAEPGIPFSVLNLRSRGRSFDRPMREFIRSCGTDSSPSGASLSPQTPESRFSSGLSSQTPTLDLAPDTPGLRHELPCDALPSIQEDLEAHTAMSSGSSEQRAESLRKSPKAIRRARLDLLAARRLRDSGFSRRISAASIASSCLQPVLANPELINEIIEDYIIDVLGCIVGLPIEFQSDYRTGMHLARTQLLKQFGAAQLSRSLGILHRIIEDAPVDANEANFLGVWARWKFPHAHRNACLTRR